uniref:SURF6 domain-containing protein n=1 Tax=Ascaris lumbricoides TaxID=6252 RepID=A0A0M3IC70_ASCLU
MHFTSRRLFSFQRIVRKEKGQGGDAKKIQAKKRRLEAIEAKVSKSKMKKLAKILERKQKKESRIVRKEKGQGGDAKKIQAKKRRLEAIEAKVSKSKMKKLAKILERKQKKESVGGFVYLLCFGQ